MRARHQRKTLVRRPEEILTRVDGMQRAEEHDRAPERHIGGTEPHAELLEKRCRAPDVMRLADQPSGDPGQRRGVERQRRNARNVASVPVTHRAAASSSTL
jgi:hypothetical protein